MKFHVETSFTEYLYVYYYVVHIFLQLCEFFLVFVEDENAWTLNMHEGTLHINKFSNSLYAELANAFIDDSDDDDDNADDDDDDDDDDVGDDVQVNDDDYDDDDDARWKVLRLLTRRCHRWSTQSSQQTAMKPFDRPPAGGVAGIQGARAEQAGRDQVWHGECVANCLSLWLWSTWSTTLCILNMSCCLFYSHCLTLSLCNVVKNFAGSLTLHVLFLDHPASPTLVISFAVVSHVNFRYDNICHDFMGST